MHSQITDQLPGPGSKQRRPLATYGVVFIMLALGLGLIFQSNRWYRTPAYGNLLHIMSADSWGYIYLGSGGLLAVGLVYWGNRLINVAAHTLIFALLVVWEVSFIIRYLTDSATTVVNVISWAAYLFLVVGSALMIDHVDSGPRA